MKNTTTEHLTEQVQIARKEIRSDGYEMSIGEVANLYREKELRIDPEYQRLFRWDITRKTRFIESLLLGIPIPPIFVFQGEDSVWELIDGLQRLSTVFQFMGILQGQRAEGLGDLVLEGTNLLPALAGKRWEGKTDDPKDQNSIGSALQIQIKRSRIRVEILQPGSDASTKFELFQRLNTGGANLTEQEIRNCVAVMLNRNFYNWIKKLSENKDFLTTIAQTETALEGQMAIELVLRIIAFCHIPYHQKLDVHEYLDDALMRLAKNNTLNFSEIEKKFDDTFFLLNSALGEQSFKRWDGQEFKGKFLMSVYEVLAVGVYQNIDKYNHHDNETVKEFILKKAKELWGNEIFSRNSGGGTRGTTRLANLLPLAKDFMKYSNG